jgi:hypothetical protein
VRPQPFGVTEWGRRLMGAAGSAGHAGVTLQFAITRRARRSCATVRELNLALRRWQAPRLPGVASEISPAWRAACGNAALGAARRQSALANPKACPEMCPSRYNRTSSGAQELRRSEAQELRSSGAQELRRSGAQKLRSSGAQKVRSSGAQELRAERKLLRSRR